MGGWGETGSARARLVSVCCKSDDGGGGGCPLRCPLLEDLASLIRPEPDRTDPSILP